MFLAKGGESMGITTGRVDRPWVSKVQTQKLTPQRRLKSQANANQSGVTCEFCTVSLL